MLGVLHHTALILLSLYLLLTAPFSAPSAVLTFAYLRSIVHPYPNVTSTQQSASSSPASDASEQDLSQLTALTWTDLLLLLPCTALVLAVAHFFSYYLRLAVYFVKSCSTNLTTKRFVRRLMGYDAAKPATWSIAQLRVYATEHHITIPSGCEKTELVALVDECLTNAILAEHIRKENAVDDAALPDILAAPVATILHHRAYPSYAQTLRQNPKKLREIIDAGLCQLESLSFVARLCSAQLLSPLGEWLEQVALAEDGGTSFRAALTPAAGAAASTVCGRFCGDGDMVVRCLDCGADPTCVMCMDCFRHSPCVNHRYRITQGSGGGMCDCGDPTAWKVESFCSLHRPAVPTSASGDAGEGQANAPNPLDTLAEEDREWVVVLLRGVIQYISLALLQYMRIVEAQKRAKTLNKERKETSAGATGDGVTTASSGAKAATPKDPDATLMEDVALIANTYDWLSGWLTPVTNRLWELMSTTEVAKQIVAQLWTEPLFLSADPTMCAAAAHLHGDEEAHQSSSAQEPASGASRTRQTDAILATLPENFSCLHPVFLFETLRPVTDRERPVKRSSPDPWRPVLAKCIGHCLSVPRLRLPVGALMAIYAECINANDRSEDNSYPLHDYQVQVLTNPDVLRYLMTPSHMPNRNATNTVVHRVLSCVLYALCVGLDQGPRNAILRTSSVERDGLIFIEHQNAHLSFGGITVMNYCLTALPAASFTLVLNRLAWRAFAQIHGTLAISGYINADPDASTDATHFPAPDFFARILGRHTWLWFNAIRAVLAVLFHLEEVEEEEAPSTASAAAAAAASMPAISSCRLTAALQVPHEMWQHWAEATRFDAPPDVSRRRRVFMQMLRSCQVENGEDEAVLLPQRGRLATLQAAAIHEHVGKEARGEGAVRGGHVAAAAPAMAPSITTAVGYVVQLLYEVSRSMDAVFQKQRDGFCQRCHTIALEREKSPGVEETLPETTRPADRDMANEERETDRAHVASSAVAGAATAADNANDDEDDRESDPSLSLPSLPVLPPSQSPIDVFEYNLLQPSNHATTFSNHLPHIFGTVLTAWVIEQQRQSEAGARHAPLASIRLSGLSDAGAAATANRAHLTRPLHTLLDCFFNFRARVRPNSTQDRLTFCQQLLDSLVMPQVLIGQVLDGLWRRDSYGVSAAVNMYTGFSRSVAAEFDMLMLQVLTMELAPADMAIQILRRFTYAKQSAGARKKMEAAVSATGARKGSTASSRTRHLAFRKYLKGYKYYLRLMLTLVVDTTKASFRPPLSAQSIERTVAHYLAQKRASHSTIIQVVSDSVRGGDFGIAEDDEKDESGNVVRFTQVIDSAIKKLATAQSTNHGKQFHIRDVQTWKSYVSLYQSSIFDSQLEEVHKNYRSIAIASRSEKHAADEDGGADATTRLALPPTQLSDDGMYAELLPTTRALLHTDALLLPALYVLHEYVNAHAPPAPAPASPATVAAAGSPLACAEEAVKSPRSEAPGSPRDHDVGGLESSSQTSATGPNGVDYSDSDDSDDDNEDTNLITREALLHAITTLYLCVQDCRAITRAMQAVESVSDDSATPAEVSGGISWDLVELYLQRYRVNELSFTSSSCAQVLPLPELLRHRTLLHKLRTHVTLHCSATTTAKAFTVSVSSADMLHRLRTHLHSNKEADIYSCLEMVEEVLVLTGLATFDTVAATAEQKAKEEAAQNRKKLIQERQAKLMQRMRSRVLKTAVTTEAAPAPAGGKDATKEGSTQSLASPSSPLTKASTASVSGSLLTKVLLELATMDCCVCRSTTEEPLFLLCHTGTSSALVQLGALPLPDERGVHNHLSICGHAAHKTCVEKLFIRLSVLWQRWNFRSQLFLGPTEFNCPLCNTIVTTLAPVPALPTGVMSPASPAVPTGVASLFEELQAAAVSPLSSGSGSSGKDRAADVVMEFQTNLANCAVGFSPSEDIPAIVSIEDALQKDNEAAWILSETIRTFFYSCHLSLESVKAGRPITHRHLISLLSLLVSLAPAKLQEAKEALRSNFERTKADQDALLLLDALLQPREAAHLIRDHVLARVFTDMPHDYLPRLLSCVPEANSPVEEGSDGAISSSAFQTAAAELEADFPGVTMAVWKATGVLAILKALLVEDASHAIILSSESFTLTGTVEFATLSVQSIQSPTARCTAVLRMLQYLLPVPHKSAAEKLPVVVQDVRQCVDNVASRDGAHPAVTTASTLSVPPTLLFTTTDAYVEQIAETLLHLPRVYAKILTAFSENKLCSVCHQEATNPVMCCRCGQHMCMRRQRSGSPPELYQHVRSCGGAVGVFLAVRQGTFYVMELTCGRLYLVPSNYTDEYGERDRNLRRGVPLFRDSEETQKLIETWMQNKWGAVSAIFSGSSRIDLTEL